MSPETFDDQAAEHHQHRRCEDEHQRHEDDDAGATGDLLGRLEALGARDVGLDAQDLDERRAALLRLDGVGDEGFDELGGRAIGEVLERDRRCADAAPVVAGIAGLALSYDPSLTASRL